MKRKRVVVIAGVVVLVVAILAWLGLFNRLFGDGYSTPACDRLPTAAEVTEAIAQNGSLVDRLTAVGPGVEVTVGTPCADTDRAMVAIRVDTGDEETAARGVLAESDGFGVPAAVERG